MSEATTSAPGIRESCQATAPSWQPTSSIRPPIGAPVTAETSRWASATFRSAAFARPASSAAVGIRVAAAGSNIVRQRGFRRSRRAGSRTCRVPCRSVKVVPAANGRGVRPGGRRAVATAPAGGEVGLDRPARRRPTSRTRWTPARAARFHGDRRRSGTRGRSVWVQASSRPMVAATPGPAARTATAIRSLASPHRKCRARKAARASGSIGPGIVERGHELRRVRGPVGRRPPRRSRAGRHAPGRGRSGSARRRRPHPSGRSSAGRDGRPPRGGAGRGRRRG